MHTVGRATNAHYMQHPVYSAIRAWPAYVEARQLRPTSSTVQYSSLVLHALLSSVGNCTGTVGSLLAIDRRGPTSPSIRSDRSCLLTLPWSHSLYLYVPFINMIIIIAAVYTNKRYE